MDYTTDVLICMSIIIAIILVIAIPLIIDEKKEEKKREENYKKEQRLNELKKLKDSGAITEKEYELEKYRIKYDN